MATAAGVGPRFRAVVRGRGPVGDRRAAARTALGRLAGARLVPVLVLFTLAMRLADVRLRRAWTRVAEQLGWRGGRRPARRCWSAGRSRRSTPIPRPEVCRRHDRAGIAAGSSLTGRVPAQRPAVATGLRLSRSGRRPAVAAASGSAGLARPGRGGGPAADQRLGSRVCPGRYRPLQRPRGPGRRSPASVVRSRLLAPGRRRSVSAVKDAASSSSCPPTATPLLRWRNSTRPATCWT